MVIDFPNNKPWLSNYTLYLLHSKQISFKQDDMNTVKEIKKAVKDKVRYKDKIEKQLRGASEHRMEESCFSRAPLHV